MRHGKVRIWLIIALAIVLVGAVGLYIFTDAKTRENETGVVISEVVTSNSVSFTDAVYGSPDWIELMNVSDRPIELSGYAIGRSDNSGVMYKLEGGTLQPGETVLLVAGATVTGGSYEATNFKLPRSGVTLQLAAPSGNIIQQLGVPALETDISYGITGDGTYAYYSVPTPNAPNSGAYGDDSATVVGTEPALILTEVLPYPSDANYTWAEVMNNGDAPVLLSQYYVTDDTTNPDKGRLPAIELAPGEYSVIKLSDAPAPDVTFGLKRTEDYIALFDHRGAEISRLTWDTAMLEDYSVGVYSDGSPCYFSTATPGAANDMTTARADSSLSEGTPDVIINELLSDNSFSLIDKYGDRSPWVELYNRTGNEVGLSSYTLSDDADEPYKWTFPDVTLGPNEYIVVFLSGADSTEDELHTSFRLGNADSVISIAEKLTGMVQRVPVNHEAGENVSFGMDEAGEWKYFPQPTPNSPNVTVGFTEITAVPESSSPVLINEVSATHATGSTESDWVELFNATDTDVSLDGWVLSTSDDPVDGVALSGTLDGGDYVVVKNGIGVSAAGETLYLFDEHGSVAHAYRTGVIRAGYTSGLSADNTQRLVYSKKTPGAANDADSALLGYCAEPVFSVPGGLVEGEFDVELATATDGAVIYYTADGTKPDASSSMYTNPIRVSSAASIKAVAVKEGYLNSETAAATYYYTEHELPVIAITIASDDLSYISASENRRDKRERECYFEYYENGKLGTRFPAGLRITGNGTRHYAQRSFNVYLRGAYGKSSVTYPFFDDYAIKEFSCLSLRNFGQDNDGALLRDAYFSMAAKGLNLDYAESDFAVVYINGKYWGLYEFKENQNEDYFNARHGVEQSSVQGVRSNTYVYNDNGNNSTIKSLFALAAKDTSNDETFEKYASKTDEAYFTDYLIMQSFIMNGDVYNQKYVGSVDGSFAWRPVFYDLDFAMSGNSPTRNVFGMFFRSEVIEVGEPDEFGVRNFVDMGLYYGFYKNAGWRERFVERYAQVLNTVLTTERLIALYDGMTTKIESEIERHIQRWHTPSSVSRWRSEADDLRQCIIDRRAYAIKALKNTFNLTNERVEMLFPNG